MNIDVIVIGGGPVGAAIAYGLAGRNLRVLVLDGGDRDFRAASANGGLIWQQGKGLGMPAYQRLTRSSVELWPEFAAELTNRTAVDLQYEQKGGLVFCQNEAEFEKQRTVLKKLDTERGATESDWEMLDPEALAKLLPKVRVGPTVAGASLGYRDGHTNPLNLLAALHAGILQRGGQLRGGVVVESIQKDGSSGFTISLGSERVSAEKVVIAAGLGSKTLAAQVGLDIPIRPQRGQGLITERMEPFLPLPALGLRQTREGTVQIMGTQDECGFDTSITNEAAAWLSARAILRIPALSEAKVVRQWAGLRILTPDGCPVYAESLTHPGAFVAVCHSGITLAAAHAVSLAEAIAAGKLPPSFDAFHHRRFDVSKTA